MRIRTATKWGQIISLGKIEGLGKVTLRKLPTNNAQSNNKSLITSFLLRHAIDSCFLFPLICAHLSDYETILERIREHLSNGSYQELNNGIKEEKDNVLRVKDLVNSETSKI